MSWRDFKDSNLKHNLSFTQPKAATSLLVTECHSAVTFYSLARAMAGSVGDPVTQQSAEHRTGRDRHQKAFFSWYLVDI